MIAFRRLLIPALALLFSGTLADELVAPPEWAEKFPELPGDPISGETKAQTCDVCHGIGGFSEHRYYPVLAGQRNKYLVYQLHRYRSNARPHPLMTPLTQDLSDQDIADLSAYYSRIEITELVKQNFNDGRWIDLTHEFSEETISHPRGQLFVHTPSVVGMTPGGFYMATYNYSGSEHAGTHLDAPVHFHEGGKSIEQLSIRQLMGDVVVINVKDKVAADMEYLVTVEDILEWEADNGNIPNDSIVLFNTGLANVWPDQIKYTGTDKRGSEGVAELKNPGIHEGAATFLSTKRQIKLVGLDSTSFDNARQSDRRSHRIFFEHGIPGMENVANLDDLPTTGAFMIVLPMKIKGGSAAPVRIIAFVPDRSPKDQERRKDIDDRSPPAAWVSLFSGESLDHFNIIGHTNWRIVDDYVEADDGERSFLVSKDRYRDFELHVEFWPSSDANSGVFLRCQDPTAIANESCYELNIYDLHTNPDNATGSIVNLAPPRVAIKAGDNWNAYDISVQGSHILVRLNDVVVVDFEDESFAEGPLGLQSNGGLIRFRNIRVRALVPEG